MKRIVSIVLVLTLLCLVTSVLAEGLASDTLICPDCYQKFIPDFDFVFCPYCTGRLISKADLDKWDYDFTEKVVSSDFRVGNVVQFGHFEQDANTENSQEPIEWIIMDMEGDKALLVSKYILADRPYNDNKNYHWKDSELRLWLNNDFLRDAFTDAEAAAIYVSQIKDSLDSNTQTEDKIFILNLYEVLTLYFPDLADRRCGPAYPRKSYSTWWVRNNRYLTNVIAADGTLIFEEPRIEEHFGVRPALWADISFIYSDTQTENVDIEGQWLLTGVESRTIPEAQLNTTRAFMASGQLVQTYTFYDGKLETKVVFTGGVPSVDEYSGTYVVEGNKLTTMEPDDVVKTAEIKREGNTLEMKTDSGDVMILTLIQ